MGLGEWFGRVLGRRRKENESKPAPQSSVPAVPRMAARAVDPLAPLRGLSLGEGVAKAIELLESAAGVGAASALLAWLRSAVTHEGLPPAPRLRLSDFFAARGDDDSAMAALRPLTESADSTAAAALIRLAELARSRGDVTTTVAMYEEILAIDVAYPSVRERLARTKAPARAGGAGATLLSPEAAKLGRGRLELVRELGRGGAGAVFLARDTSIAREVALKIYHPARRADRGARLRAEAQIAASLASRHVVRVYDLFEEMGAVSMEFCPGGTMRAAIARRDASPAVRRSWTRAIALALATTHERGWVHRDVKPGNVLFRIDGAPVLTDFGLARRIGSAIEPTEGTAGFLAPELRTSHTADPRLDVFAFGVAAREIVGADDAVLAGLIAASTAPEPDARPRDGAALVRAIDAAGVTDE